MIFPCWWVPGVECVRSKDMVFGGSLQSYIFAWDGVKEQLQIHLRNRIASMANLQWSTCLETSFKIESLHISPVVSGSKNVKF
jgi:hypothetical protein